MMDLKLVVAGAGLLLADLPGSLMLDHRAEVLALRLRKPANKTGWTFRGALKKATKAVTTRLRGTVPTENEEMDRSPTSRETTQGSAQAQAQGSVQDEKKRPQAGGSDDGRPKPTTCQPTVTYQPQALAVGDRIRSSFSRVEVGEQGAIIYEFPEGKQYMGEIVEVNENGTYNIVYDDGDEALEAREFLQGKMLIQKLVGGWAGNCPHPTEMQTKLMSEKIQNLLKVLEKMREVDFYVRKELEGNALPLEVEHARRQLRATVEAASLFQKQRDSDMRETLSQITDPKEGHHEDGEPAMTKLTRRIMMRLTAIMRTLAFANNGLSHVRYVFGNTGSPHVFGKTSRTNLLQAAPRDLQFLSFCKQQVGDSDDTYKKLEDALSKLKVACAAV